MRFEFPAVRNLKIRIDRTQAFWVGHHLDFTFLA